MKFVKYVFTGAIAVLVIAVLVFYAFNLVKERQTTENIVTVAVIDSGQADSHASLSNVQRIIKIYEGQKEDSNLKVNYLYYDDTATAASQQQVLSEIKSDAALIIGDQTSPVFSEKGALPFGGGIPVLSTSDAVLNGEDNVWYRSLLPSDKSQAIFLANYIEQVLGYTSVVIVQEYDPKREVFSTSFQKSFLGLGGKVQIKTFDETAKNSLDAVNALVDELNQENTSLALTRKSKLIGSMLGAVLFMIDLVLVEALRESPSTKILVCRKIKPA